MEQNRSTIYLDNFTLAHTTSRVEKALEEGRREAKYDITAPYQANTRLHGALEKSFEYLYELVGADPGDRFFFGASEAQLSAEVLVSFLIDEMHQTGKNHLIAPATEKASILRTMERLKDIGCTVTLAEVDENGQVTVEELAKHITPRTALFATSWVDGLLGTIRPIWELCEFCKEKGVATYVQGSEIFAKLFFRFRDLPIDYLSFSGELFHAPKGTAGLFVRKGIKAPVVSYPLGSRLATFEGSDPALLISMGEAACEVLDLMDSMCMEIAHLREKFETVLERGVEGITFFAKGSQRVPNVSCFAIDGVHAELLLFHLANEGVYATFGGGQRQKLEHVLTAGGIEKGIAKCAISVAMSYQTSEREIDEAAKRVIEVAARLKKKSGAMR